LNLSSLQQMYLRIETYMGCFLDMQVFSFLDDTALCHAAMVCRQWRAASAHEDFWKSLNFDGRKVSHDQVVLLCVRYPKATELNLGGPFVDDVLVREAMRSLR
jgi:hypothetical protein